MRAIRLHFILGYAVFGALSPFFSEFLRSDRHLDAHAISIVFAVAQTAVLFSPVILTFIADRTGSARLVAGIIYGLSTVTLVAFSLTRGFMLTLACYTAFAFVSSAMFPSQDGLFFAMQRRREKDGLPTPPYHRVRVLGTLGFIVPSVLLLVLIPHGGSLEVTLPTAAVIAFVGLVNAMWLPNSRDTSPEGAGGGGSRLPTSEAARALFSRRAIAFCVAMALLQISSSAYYMFYQVHLVQSLGVESRWLGMISTVGVGVEAMMMFAFGWACTRLGPGRMIAIGALVTAARMFIVALAPESTIAVLANLLHGPIILGTLVAPVVFVNRLAGDTFRNSMQGVFNVAVLGPWRIGGSLLCGWLAGIDTRLAFVVGGSLAAIAALLVFFFVSDPAEKTAI